MNRLTVVFVIGVGVVRVLVCSAAETPTQSKECAGPNFGTAISTG